MIIRFSLAVVATSTLFICGFCHAGTLSPSDIFRHAREAAGGDRWDHLSLIAETGTEQTSGLTGTAQRVDDIRTGRWRKAFDAGIYRTADVWDGSDVWHQDRSGGVHAYNSMFMRLKAQTNSWLTRRGYLRPDALGAHLQAAGEKTEGGRAFDVVHATPQGGIPVELWFDSATYFLDRAVLTMPTSTLTERYADYRHMSGVILPYKTMIEDGTPADTDVFAVTRATVEAIAKDTDFARPKPPDDFTVAGGVSTVPIIFDYDVIVDAKLNGKPFSFILDTGGHDLLTPQAALALGLKPVGAGADGGAGDNTVLEQYVRVAHVEIGGVSLRDQSFKVVPIQYDFTERGLKPPLAGLLGLELFERFAMRLDYRKQTLTFRPLSSAPKGRGVAVPIRFTDDTPLVSAKIDGMAGDNALDTGDADALVMQGRWADAHGLGPKMRSGFRLSGLGMGGATNTWGSRANLEIAGIGFPHTVAYYTEDKKGSFSSRTEAGNIGNTIFSNFTLCFDYARDVIWFEYVPGLPAEPFARAGFNFYKQEREFFVVSSVVPMTPAAEAGVSIGDKIMAVNGTPAVSLTDWDLRRLMRETPGTKMILSIQRNGRPKRLTVTLRELMP